MRILICTLIFSIYSVAAPATTIHADHVDVQLLAGQKLSSSPEQIGVHFKLDEHWHVYWQNPGDSGSGPKFKLSAGDITNIHWPYPERISVSTLTNYGYNNEVVIFLDLKDLSRDSVLELEWLVCKVECVPGFGSFKIDSDTISVRSDLYQNFQTRLPGTSSWTSQFKGLVESSFRFSLEPDLQTSIQKIRTIDIFPKNGEYFLNTSPSINILDNSLDIQMPTNGNAVGLKNAEDFVIVTELISGVKSSFNLSIDKSVSKQFIFLGILLAFLGGVILNVMPCVFPILFLKAFSFLKTTDAAVIKKSSLLYTAGVLTSFLIIGTTLIALRLGGESIGWGFHMQSSGMVTGLAILFFFLGLVFLDVINLDRLPSSFNWTSHRLFSSDFGTGILAVVVASPCTAPFMGTALGMTLFLPPWQSILIFLFLGLGLALPILVLAHWPQLALYLPRSGPWMIKFKQLLAIPMFATGIWLASVFAMQISAGDPNEASQIWDHFDAKKIELVRKERPVFIDFTAAWCITCQVNKKAVLETEEIMRLFKDNNIYLVRADWTKRNPEVTKALSGFGRNSVPLYIYYEQGARDAKVLPEILTKSEMFETINKGN